MIKKNDQNKRSEKRNNSQQVIRICAVRCVPELRHIIRMMLNYASAGI